MPKPPKKYNSPNAKSLTDEELTRLWFYVEKQAEDDDNLIAVREPAFRIYLLILSGSEKRNLHRL